MALSEDTQRRIQDYLEDAMSAEERLRFEAEMRGDEELAEEVALQQEMEAFLAETPENDLRKSLQALGEQAEDDERPNNWWYLLSLIPLFGAAWWLFRADTADLTTNTISEPSSPTAEEEAVEVDITEVDSTVEKVREEIITTEESTEENSVGRSAKKEDPKIFGTSNRRDVEKSIPKEEKQNETPTTTTNKIKAVPPVDSTQFDTTKIDSSKIFSPIDIEIPITEELANIPVTPVERNTFEAIPELDFIIGNNTRDKSLLVEITKQQENTVLSSLDELTKIQIAGRITPSDSTSQALYNFLLFSNDSNAFENFEPLDEIAVELGPLTQGSYSFQINKEIALPAGLYYYLIEDVMTEDIIYIAKFYVQ